MISWFIGEQACLIFEADDGSRFDLTAPEEMNFRILKALGVSHYGMQIEPYTASKL